MEFDKAIYKKYLKLFDENVARLGDGVATDVLREAGRDVKTGLTDVLVGVLSVAILPCLFVRPVMIRALSVAKTIQASKLKD